GWAALDLALMAEGMVVVPLYSRAAPAELASVLKDSEPRRLFVGDQSLAERVSSAVPPAVLLHEVFFAPDLIPPLPQAPISRSDGDLVTIMYTSGTAGEPKGVCLSVGNVTFMLSRTSERLNRLMAEAREPERVFHYLPFNFTASWIALLT